MKYTSIIITSFISNELRKKMLYTSMDSLLETTKDLPVEIIFVDNGGGEDYMELKIANGDVQCYIQNATNLHFGFARNQGIAMAKGEYLVIADNDIYYEKGWLEKCIEVLEEHPDEKIYATPIAYPASSKYTVGTIKVKGVEYPLDMRAGSNCFVIRRKDLDIIGSFLAHRIAGSRWTDRAVKLGYLAAVVPGNLIKDLGLRNGYAHNQAIPIKRTLRNGEEILFNEDEYRAL